MAFFQFTMTRSDGTVTNTVVQADTLGQARNAFGTFIAANGITGEITGQTQLPNDFVPTSFVNSDGRLINAGEDPGGGGVPPPDSGTGGTTEPVADPIQPIQQPSDPTQQNPLLGAGTQFRQFLRSRGVDPDSFAGRRIGRFQDRALSLSDLGTSVGLFGQQQQPDANNPFQQRLDQGLLNTLGSNAVSAFQNLLNPNISASGDRAAIFRDAAPGDIGAEQLRDVAGLALGGRTNLGFANRFANALINRFANEFTERADLDPTNQQTFAQFLNERLQLV